MSLSYRCIIMHDEEACSMLVRRYCEASLVAKRKKAHC